MIKFYPNQWPRETDESSEIPHTNRMGDLNKDTLDLKAWNEPGPVQKEKINVKDYSKL